jgi:hypothetical protein
VTVRSTIIEIVMRIGSSTRIGLFALAVAVLPPIALAHHSFAMFDATKTLTVQGTVKDFQWGNPHTWLDVLVLDQDGTAKPLSLELNGVSGLVRHGWKPGTLQPGDKVEVAYHPIRDGTPAGQLVQLVTAQGRTLKEQ